MDADHRRIVVELIAVSRLPLRSRGDIDANEIRYKSSPIGHVYRLAVDVVSTSTLVHIIGVSKDPKLTEGYGRPFESLAVDARRLLRLMAWKVLCLNDR